MKKNRATLIDPMSWAEVSRKAIEHNLAQVRALAKANPCHKRHKKRPFLSEILAVVKADAYGHGMEGVAGLLQEQGVSFFAVSDVNEAIKLRACGIDQNILVFRSNLPESIRPIIHYDLIPTVYTLGFAQSLNRSAVKAKKRIPVHLKIDTGMGRAGIWYKDAYSLVKRIFGLSNLSVQGIYTHFPAADTNQKFTYRQIKIMEKLIEHLDSEGIVIPFVHAANSAGLIAYRTQIFNMFRPGLMIYGLYPHPGLKRKMYLMPALSVKSKVLYARATEKGCNISYGGTFITKKKMKLATVPIGYNDGYPRLLSNKAFVLIRGQRCPVLGRVTMDQIVVDVTKLRGVKAGDIAVILGRQGGKSITADDLARMARTINYEIVCSLGNRLSRRWK